MCKSEQLKDNKTTSTFYLHLTTTMDYTSCFDEGSVPETEDEQKTFFLKLHLTAAENNESGQFPNISTMPVSSVR